MKRIERWPVVSSLIRDFSTVLRMEPAQTRAVQHFNNSTTLHGEFPLSSSSRIRPGYVWLSPHEEIQWSFSQIPTGGSSYATGYGRVVKSPDFERAFPALHWRTAVLGLYQLDIAAATPDVTRIDRTILDVAADLVAPRSENCQRIGGNR